MRILIVNHFPLEGSGSGIYTQNLARELAERGNEVKVIFPDHADQSYPGFSSRVILFKGPETTSPDLDFNFPCFTSHPKSNETFYNLTDEQMQAYIDTFVQVTKEEAESFRPDVIHAQHLWITPYAALQTGIPYVITAHGTDLKGFVKDERYHPYALEAAAGAGRIITISKQVDEEVHRLYGTDRAKQELILNGYNEELFKVLDLSTPELMDKLGVEEPTNYTISFAGKFTDFKGIDVLLRAYAIVEEKLASTRLILAGHGDLYEELVALRKSLGLDRVTFLGHVDQKTLVYLYNLADVSCVPSRSEPFGLVAIEALACGTPVVGTNQGGLPDFITPEVGHLVPVEDHEALAQAILEELTHPEKSQRDATCAAYALASFSWKHAIASVEDLYRRIMKEG